MGCRSRSKYSTAGLGTMLFHPRHNNKSATKTKHPAGDGAGHRNQGYTPRKPRRKHMGLLKNSLFFFCLLAVPAAETTEQDSVADLVKKSSEAVVLITISDSSGRETALGSGFLVTADGEIVTNYHVIKDAHSAIVKLSNGAFFPVNGVLASDAEKDLAILKVNGKNLPFLTIGDLSRVQVGEHVVAIGSPLGLEGTVSDGVV